VRRRDTSKCVARYDAKNPVALKQLVGFRYQDAASSRKMSWKRATRRPWSTTRRRRRSNPEFKKIYDDYKKFLDEQILWFRVAENEYARFMYSRKSDQAKPPLKKRGRTAPVFFA
jgi:TRAP-type mannitol/chloroaromatic compound transport system substrate-binding protein